MDPLRRVLVLDFDEALLINLERLLEDSGLSATTTWNVAEAHTLMASGRFNFLVMGHRPPKLDAPAILQDLRGRSLSFGSFVLGSRDTHPEKFSRVVEGIIASTWCPPSRETRHAPIQGASGIWGAS